MTFGVKLMNFFEALAFVFSDGVAAVQHRRLWQSRLVARDAWLEAGGCETCAGSMRVRDRRLEDFNRPCPESHVLNLGLDPSMDLNYEFTGMWGKDSRLYPITLFWKGPRPKPFRVHEDEDAPVSFVQGVTFMSIFGDPE